MRSEGNPIDPVLNGAATVAVLAITVMGAFFSSTLDSVLAGARAFMVPFLEWYYVLLVAFLFFFIAWLGMGRYRHVRLGSDTEAPEFRTFSWLAMLFAAGTGVGLIFWSIAEPVMHFSNNPFTDPDRTPEAAMVAMRLSFFHWGLNGWAIFSTVALVLAYFGFRRGHPLTLSASLRPLFGRLTAGPFGQAVDLFGVMATVFGVATTLGLGARQMSTGFTALFDIPASTSQQLVVIAVVTVAATISVTTGVRRGVRFLSVGNFWLTFVILGFFLIFGPTQYQMGLLVQSTGDYLQHLIELSFWTDANQATDWQSRWTVFFWGWWIAWSPFVGMFIARISRGRTIGEFVFGVMLVPSIFSFVWIALFGGTALHAELFGVGGIAGVVEEDVARALFVTLDSMQVDPWLATAAGALATLLIATYFVTSADSGTLVITTLLCRGNISPPKWLRALWSLGLGILTAVLLLAGGVATLQSAVVMAALPFSVVLTLMVAGLIRALDEEPQSPRRGQRSRAARDPLTETEPPPCPPETAG